MTLDAMIQLCAKYTDTVEELSNTSSESYIGDSLTLANTFTDGINLGKDTVCRDYMPDTVEDVTLDSNVEFDVADLDKTCKRIVSVKVNGYGMNWVRTRSTKFTVVGANIGDVASIEYAFIPTDLSTDDLTGEFGFYQGIVDDKMFAFYGAFHYLEIEGDPHSLSLRGIWLSRFNDMLQSINPNMGEIEQIADVFGEFLC